MTACALRPNVECRPMTFCGYTVCGMAVRRCASTWPNQWGMVCAYERTLSWYALRTAGYTADNLPTRYVLDAGDGSGLAESRPAVTGDAKLDALITSGVVRCQPEAGGFCIQAPFAAGRACPLAFALTACTVTDGQAVLHVRRNSAPFQAGR